MSDNQPTNPQQPVLFDPASGLWITSAPGVNMYDTDRENLLRRMKAVIPWIERINNEH